MNWRLQTISVASTTERSTEKTRNKEKVIATSLSFALYACLLPPRIGSQFPLVSRVLSSEVVFIFICVYTLGVYMCLSHSGLVRVRQPINGSPDQPTNQPTNQQLTNRPTNQPTTQPLNQLTNQPTKHRPSTDQPLNQPIDQPTHKSASNLTLHVPGSDSSALTTRKDGRPSVFFGMNDHFKPEGNPAPPRPLRPESFISCTIQSGPIHMISFVWYLRGREKRAENSDKTLENFPRAPGAAVVFTTWLSFSFFDKLVRARHDHSLSLHLQSQIYSESGSG